MNTNEHTRLVPGDVDGLITIFDRHGCWLPKDVKSATAASWGVAEGTVKRRLDARLDALEVPWSISASLTPEAVDAISIAVDGVAAYATLKSMHVAPPTQRMFYTGVLFSSVLPELEALREREIETVNLMVRGLGSRACADCRRFFGRVR